MAEKRAQQKPILIYDGDCSFCMQWIARWKYWTGDAIDYAPSQEVAAQYPQISAKKFRQSVQYVDSDRRVYSGAEAVFRSLAVNQRKRWMLWAYERIPLFVITTEWFYRLVAAHRNLFSRLTHIFWGKDVQPSTYLLASSLFLRFLAIIFFVAFLSLAFQIKGLVGSNGIIPAQEFLNFVHQRVGGTGYRLVPSIFWLQSNDLALQLGCWAGALISIALFFKIAPSLLLLILWMIYLSYCAICRDFLAFQWDVLLLETGALAIFLAPPKLRVRHFVPSAFILFLLHWLLFRLNFSSGAVKLLSGDPTWRNLTALNFHYETQPLPTWIGWYFHHLPPWFQKGSVLVTFFVELIVPFFIFFPRRIRNLGCYVLILFQLFIMLTGNYAFFNLLTICLCILLVDDQSWPNWIRRRTAQVVRTWPMWVVVPFFAVVIFGSLIQMSITLRLSLNSATILQVERWLEPFRTINRYGLFAVMTTRRTEIIIEGSDDGLKWSAYEFKYKPGDLKRKPAFVEPHQPRLDWQMWFAALGNYQDDSWFIPYCARLLQGSPDVLALMAKNPFPAKPPHYVRAMVYEYHFTDLKSKSSQGLWWKREIQGSYCPVLSFRDGRLVGH